MSSGLLSGITIQPPAGGFSEARMFQPGGLYNLVAVLFEPENAPMCPPLRCRFMVDPTGGQTVEHPVRIGPGAVQVLLCVGYGTADQQLAVDHPR